METFLYIAMQSVLLKSIRHLDMIYPEIDYEFIYSIGNMLRDQEITLDPAAKL